MMTRDQAEQEAIKRERHKSKHMVAKRWAAQHDSVRGWHVSLIDNHAPVGSSFTDEGPTLGDFLAQALEFLRSRA